MADMIKVYNNYITINLYQCLKRSFKVFLCSVILFYVVLMFFFKFIFQTFTVPIIGEEGHKDQKFNFSLSSNQENGPQASFECLESRKPA